MTLQSLTIHPASACFAGDSHELALSKLCAGVSEAALGDLDLGQAQLCPQHRSTLGEAECERLLAAHPGTRFRLHANVSCRGLFGIHDASSLDSERTLSWKAALRESSEQLGAPAYSWHAGRRRKEGVGDLERMRDRTLDLQARLGIPVAVEGLYPAQENWLLASFSEYEWLLGQPELRFAIDLSHCQIVARHEGAWAWDLIEALVTDARCIEVHLSENDGRRDAHRKCSREPIWAQRLAGWVEAGRVSAAIFSEGLQREPGSARPAALAD